MPPRGESFERLVITDASTVPELEAEPKDPTTGLSPEGLPRARQRLNLPDNAGWREVANAIARRNGLNPDYDARMQEHTPERAVREGLHPNATEAEINSAIMDKLRRNTIIVDEEGSENKAA